MSELKKTLSTRTLIMVVIGSCLGSGIFLTPNEVATEIPPATILPIWALGGFISLAGALTYAELGGLFPKAGGIYVYLREAFHPIVAFLYGWSVLTVITSGAIAALALGFARYTSELVPLSEGGRLVLAIAAIVVVTIINLVGVRFADIFTNLVTALKVLGVMALIAIGISMGDVEMSTYSSTEMPVSSENSLINAIGLALIGVMFSFGGFQHASYLSAEAKDGKRSVPRAMVSGVIIITVLYLLTNYAYMKMLPYEELMATDKVAASAVGSVWPLGGKLIALLVALSTFGTVGVYTLTAPRIYYAMADDGNFFPFIAKVHPKFKTPAAAILLQSGWAIVLIILLGTFEDILTFTVFVDWIFLLAAALCIFVFRKRMKGEQRPFKTPLYPIVPAIFVIMAGFIVINTLISKTSLSLQGLALLAAGVPIYFIFRYYQRKRGNA